MKKYLSFKIEKVQYNLYSTSIFIFCIQNIESSIQFLQNYKNKSTSKDMQKIF